MKINMSWGLLLVVLGGIMEGTFALCMKFTRNWKWEHIWGAATFAALVLIPWPLALLTVPNLAGVFHQACGRDLLWSALFGLGWGVGSLFFGMGLDAVGVAVGVSVMMGLIAVVGSLLPLLLYHSEIFGELSGLIMTSALIVMVVGITLSAWAGSLREKALRAPGQAAASLLKNGLSFRRGLVFCVLSGFTSPLVNFALVQGESLKKVAIANGTSPAWAANPVWAIVFTACCSLNVGYCLCLMIKRKNFGQLVGVGIGRYWILAAIMGAVWAGGIAIYGLGVSYLGSFGAYAGWSIMLIASIVAGNVSGVIVGEWKGTGTRPLTTMGVALTVLMIAVVMLGYANRLLAG
jgi:L-rhamnose-H+ transport protein